MAQITEDYVSFETAKFLKEKGFDWSCEHQYINCSSGHPFLTDIRDDAGCYYENSKIGQDEYSAPTLQMAMKWLREVHNLFIEIYFDTADMYCDASIYGLNNERKKKIKEFPTYEQACEAAIKYCLENLVK